MKFYDISKTPNNGCLILPLSQAKLASTQNPEAIYDFLKFFAKKIKHVSVDVLILYTNGLYFNSDDISSQIRPTSNNQMVQHRMELQKMILDRVEFMPQAFHFVAWDQLILNSDRYFTFMSRIRKAFDQDTIFQSLIERDLAGREMSDATVNFILEELVVSHLIRQKWIDIPLTISGKDGWRLIAYAGSHMLCEAYVLQKQILPMNSKIDRREFYARSLYNYEEKILVDYLKVPLGDFPKAS